MHTIKLRPSKQCFAVNLIKQSKVYYSIMKFHLECEIRCKTVTKFKIKDLATYTFEKQSFF